MKKQWSIIGIGLALLGGAPAHAIEGTGLNIAASGDIVATGNLSQGAQPTNIMVRGAEIGLYAPADHLFDGALSIAAHGNEPDVGLELHEAWIGSSKLIPRSRFRLGQYFLGVGRLNQFHQHDWPFISAPRIHQTLFAFEGVFDTGLEYSYLFPYVPFFLEATAGVTNGYTWGHSHNRANAKPPKIATYYGRLVTYVPVPWDGGSQIGLNYLANRDSNDVDFKLIGLDFTAKWKEVKTNLFFLQSEIWCRTQRNGTGAKQDNTFGFYVYPEYYLGEDFFIGLRVDYFSNLNVGLPGFETKDYEWNFVPTLSYKPSHFATFRLAYNHRPETNQAAGISRTQKYVELQSIFIIGAHPAHDF